MISEIRKKFDKINKIINSNLVIKAFEMANELHKDQRRKDGTLYISHPLEVALILVNQGFDEDVVSAALLHDVVEDCACCIEEIKNNFNSNIANLVDAVSAIDKNKYKYSSDEIYEDENFIKTSAEERTFKKLISIGKKYPLSFSIKFADRLHNLRTLSIFDRSKQLEKVRETEKWILPIAKILGAEYFYTELSNECFKIVNESYNCGFFSQYNYYHKTNKNNFDNLLVKIKEIFSNTIFSEIKGFDIFENLVFEELSKLTRIDDIRKISQGQILKVSNYNIYFLHNKNINKDAISEFVTAINTKMKGQLKIIDAKISTFTKRICFVLEDNYRNKYNANIMSKNDYVTQMHGTMDGQLNNYIDDENTHFIPTEYIKIKTRSEEIKYLPKDSTALDFAFKVHRDVGFGFKYAIINDSKTKLPPYTKLNDGDKIEIMVSRDDNGNVSNNVEFKWLAYVNNELSKKILIKYFEKNYVNKSNNG